MAIKWISTAWKSSLEVFPQDHRIYIDFRQKQYPEIAGSPTFTLIADTDNQPGSHNLTGGYANYLLDMPSTMTLEIYFLPTFNYDVASDQYIWGWYNDATHYLSFRYDQTTDKYLLAWRDGGTERTMLSSAYVNNATLQVWTRATFSLDLTTGTTAGSAFYLAGSLVSDAWSGNIDVKARYFPIFNVRNLTGTAGSATINYIRLFQSKTTTATEIGNNFKTIKNEETVFHYNGCALGHTRCNVTSRANQIDIERSIETPIGNATSNTATVQLYSYQGCFADDQYAAFNPASEIYNGTSSQKYMQARCPIEIETWYGGLFELEFTGRIDDNLFTRKSSYADISRVTVTAYDVYDEMKRRTRRKASTYENYNISDPSTPAASLLHVIGKMATQQEWFNFLSNSSFENVTIGNSWLVSGAGATISAAAGGLFGTKECQLVYGAAASSLYQTISFTGTKKLNVGQKWNFSAYVKCANAATLIAQLSEYDGAVEIDFTTSAALVLAGGEGWRKIEVTHTVTDNDSDNLRCLITLSTNVTLSIDAAMLVQNDAAFDWFVLNNNDGTAGTSSADDADSSLFDTCGYDVDDAMIVHPWAIVSKGIAVSDYIQKISAATVARYMGFDACGTLKYRTPLKAAYADPTPIFTVSQTRSVDSVMDILQANKIKIHGVIIVKESAKKLVWSAQDSGLFDVDDNGFLYITVANGATWPSPTIYGELWCKYSDLANKDTGGTPVVNKPGIINNVVPAPGSSGYLYSSKNYEIIGIYPGSAVQANVTDGGSGVYLTQTIFDTTTSTDSAHLLLTNSTGVARILRSCFIRARLITKLSGDEGYLHDSYVDYESIRKNGEILCEDGNDFVVTSAQVNKIADYTWKMNSTKRHIYTLTRSGFQTYFEPSEWYTAQIGAAGLQEYIDSVCECYSIRTSISSEGIGTTTLGLREMYQNWVFDSNETARSIASGQYNRTPKSTDIVVASSTYSGVADYYCDGTDDDVEINNAIIAASQKGGAIVKLTEGTFNTTATIDQSYSNVWVVMSNGTIVDRNFDGYTWKIEGTSGTYITNCKIEGGVLQQTDGNNDYPIYCRYVENTIITNVEIVENLGSGIYLSDVAGCIVSECKIHGPVSGIVPRGIYCTDSDNNIIKANIIENYTANTVIGIAIVNSSSGNTIYNNIVNNLESSASDGSGISYGIYTEGDYDSIIGNKISNCHEIYFGNHGVGIYVGPGNVNRILNNSCLYNGKCLLDRYDCEDANPPSPFTEVTNTLSNCTFARSNLQAHSGTYSYLYTKAIAAGTASSAYLSNNTNTTDMHGLIAGHSYIFTSYVYIPAGGMTGAEVVLNFSEYYSGSWHDNTQAAAATYDAWQLVSVASVTLNAATTGVRMGFRGEATAALNETFYVDDIEFYDTNPITNDYGRQFVDGGTDTQIG